jgi:ABC-2 type transport system ATP-binding protein
MEAEVSNSTVSDTSSTQPLLKPDPSLAIQTFNLTRLFGNLVAVNAINLNIKQGELFALLGPNGAGKTTAIGMLCCLLKPSSGTAMLMGHDIINEPYAVKQILGVAPQETTLSDRLTPLENLELVAILHGIPANKARKWSKLMLETIGLETRAKDQVYKFSGGMKRKLSIGMALINDPRILILDEPTLGLDPQSRRAVWEYIARLKGEKTILLTTHYMEEADSLADRISIMDQGKIITQGSPMELKTSMLDRHTLIVKAWNISQNAINELRRFFSEVSTDGGTIYITDNRLDLTDIVNRLHELGVSVRGAYFKEPTLEDVFIRLTGKELRA